MRAKEASEPLFTKCMLSWLALTCIAVPLENQAQPIRGRLANPGFQNQRIKATYFFTGQALDGSNYYGTTPCPVTLRTVAALRMAAAPYSARTALTPCIQLTLAT